MTDIHFILASQSPRRRQLLELLPITYSIVVPDVDEDAHLGPDPALYVLRTAQQKANAVVENLSPAGPDERLLIIAADTTVALEGRILGKPADSAEARQMLAVLRDRTHQVHTGLCLIDPATGREALSVQSTAVTMRQYQWDEIDAYVSGGDPYDKAGAYAIQHPVFRPVASLDGCYLGVMGLSVCDLIRQLERVNIRLNIDITALTDAHQGFACSLLDEIRRDTHPAAPAQT